MTEPGHPTASRNTRWPRSLARQLFTITFTTVLIATNVMGSRPDNPLSLGLRQAAADGLPAPFAADLNLVLADSGLPTLPPANFREPLEFVDLGLIDLVLGPAPSGTSIPIVTPTSRPVPVRTPRSADADFFLEKPDTNPVGTWALDFTEGNTNYYTIEAEGDGYVVTFIDQSGVGETPILSQSWDGTVLTFAYTYPPGGGADATIDTIRIETFAARLAYGTISIDIPSGNFYSGRITLYRIP